MNEIPEGQFEVWVARLRLAGYSSAVAENVTYFYLRRARETINDPDGSRYDLEKIEGNVSLLESRHQERLNMLNSTGPWNVPGYMKRMYEEFPSMNAEDQVRLRKSGWPARAQNSCT